MSTPDESTAATDYQAIFELATVGLARIDLHSGRLLAANAEFCRLAGLSPGEVSQKRLLDPVHPDDRARAGKKFHDMAEGRVSLFDDKHRYLFKGGGVKWVHVRAKTNGSGITMAVVSDITATHETQTLQAKSTESYRGLYEQAAVGIERVSRSGRFLGMNPRLCGMLGYSAAELLEMGYAEITHPEDLTKEEPLVEKLFASEIPEYRIEKRLLCQNGKILWVRVTSSLGKGSLLSEPFRLSIVEDISREMTAREELQKAMEELSEANHELEQYNSVIAHDLLTPLSSMRMLVAELQNEPLNPEERREYLDMVKRSCVSMERMIRDLLELSRIAHQPPPSRNVDLNEPVREVLQLLGAKIDDCKAEIVTEPLPHVEGDPTQLRQLFQNLIANALKYCPDNKKPQIRITTRPGRGRRQVIAVEDNGLGFDERQARLIFQPFKRLHRDREGTGIGLAICEKIVRRHGGEIWATGKPGQGATFVIELPPAEHLSAASAA